MRTGSLDTTLWTRFCQPASLLHACDPDVERWVATTIAVAIRTAVAWADQLCLPGADPASRWQNLFRQTYRLELRPEAQNRPTLLHASNLEWFDEVMHLARAEPGDPIRLSWTPRRMLGKPLNALRLFKAAFTYEGGAAYLAAKLERHAGVPVAPGSWQRRHPLLAAPMLIWRVRRTARRPG
jgi:hypothetical protein